MPLTTAVASHIVHSNPPRLSSISLRAVFPSAVPIRCSLRSVKVIGDRRTGLKPARLPRRLMASSSEIEAEELREMPVLERIKFKHVNRVFNQEELDLIFKEYPQTLIILKCKAKYCRPCMAFAKKYLNFADEFPDVLFLEIMGDESKETRLMMVEFEVKATPTFRYYIDGVCVTVTVGIKQEKLRNAIGFFRPQENQTGVS